MLTLLAALLAAPTLSAAAPRRTPNDVCVALPGIFEFAYQDVETLMPGRTIPLHGIFVGPQGLVAPFNGSAAMTFDGSVRLGIQVYGGLSGGVLDFTMRGVTDTSLAGSFVVEFDGDSDPDGSMPLQSVGCSTIAIP
jgi:hypothetical protein